jgi:hypothetical protein
MGTVIEQQSNGVVAILMQVSDPDGDMIQKIIVEVGSKTAIPLICLVFLCLTTVSVLMVILLHEWKL